MPQACRIGDAEVPLVVLHHRPRGGGPADQAPSSGSTGRTCFLLEMLVEQGYRSSARRRRAVTRSRLDQLGDRLADHVGPGQDLLGPGDRARIGHSPGIDVKHGHGQQHDLALGHRRRRRPCRRPWRAERSIDGCKARPWARRSFPTCSKAPRPPFHRARETRLARTRLPAALRSRATAAAMAGRLRPAIVHQDVLLDACGSSRCISAMGPANRLVQEDQPVLGVIDDVKRPVRAAGGY